MLSSLYLNDIGGGVNLIDLGASGRLSPYWLPLAHLINLYAFDPNKEECKRLSSTKNNFASSHYIPAAIAGKKGEFTLYKTRSMYNWSLLEPNTPRLSRFSIYDYFIVESTEAIEAISLSDVEQLKHVDVDAIKSDTQGLELPILAGAMKSVKSAFSIETETGFDENYISETTFRQISKFMNENDFLLFDLNANHRVSRKNHFSHLTCNGEIFYCEALWLKDYISIEKREGLHIDRAKALKALILCANHGCIDYGYELATLFCNKNLITESELDTLREYKSWKLNKIKGWDHRLREILKVLFNFIPNNWSRELAKILSEVSQKPNPIW